MNIRPFLFDPWLRTTAVVCIEASPAGKAPAMIRYQTTLDGITRDRLHQGFFDGWWNAPDADTHLRILEGSDVVVLAIDEAAGEPCVVGFVSALTDGVLYGTVTLLEVVPEYKGRSIGRELMMRVTDALGPLYRIDLIAGTDVVDFYAKVGYGSLGEGGIGLMRADYAFQPGRHASGERATPRPGTEH